ncbi:response regulator transcription factor [Vibrio parahaemolyticus]|uniref:DNA-binding response regulator n=3 Tax=Vibrionaceae TaxID=641 RepID=A0ABN5HPS9_9VIBR|nr:MULTISPECIES: response regulator transcription factor [Vibrio]OOI01317.1 DNA-binding response regulator [Vibrio sp. OULL4]AVH29038.1 DNA-binding response regulator [Vibrio diabolicus]EGQ7795049.1 response regulator transcription factor [Vibrio parahaemolyticus]EGQ7808733.1 response regulator transcription factor [Vibrio parahaemolyticus]EGQ9272266.1 response regulator transcription factor [Vibrio parahaemolyticus]
MENKQILVVDDNLDLREALSDYLGRAGFEVLCAENGDVMWQLLNDHHPDLIILDIMMPGEDGFTLCQKLRKNSDIPIIMLTAVTEEADRVAGLEMGADDYITKSFSPRELLARIKTILRRSQSTANSKLTRKVRFDDWLLDTVTRQLTHVASREVKQLSGADLSLLGLFVNHAQSILSRDDIAREIWGRDADPFERGIDVQISRLRHHLEDKDRSLILTVRNKGYMLTTDVHYEN